MIDHTHTHNRDAEAKKILKKEHRTSCYVWYLCWAKEKSAGAIRVPEMKNVASERRNKERKKENKSEIIIIILQHTHRHSIRIFPSSGYNFKMVFTRHVLCVCTVHRASCIGRDSVQIEENALAPNFSDPCRFCFNPNKRTVSVPFPTPLCAFVPNSLKSLLANFCGWISCMSGFSRLRSSPAYSVHSLFFCAFNLILIS